MSLREQAAADLRAFVEDTDGFGWPITVTNPSGVSAALVGLSTDIGLSIDPDTGMTIAGRRASIALAISKLEELSLGVPRGIADPTSKPWVIEFADIGGTAHKFKVSEAQPDRAIGLVVCFLEGYKS